VEYVKVTENGRIEERLTIDERERCQFDAEPAAKHSGDGTDATVKWPELLRKFWDFIREFFFA